MMRGQKVGYWLELTSWVKERGYDSPYRGVLPLFWGFTLAPSVEDREEVVSFIAEGIRKTYSLFSNPEYFDAFFRHLQNPSLNLLKLLTEPRVIDAIAFRISQQLRGEDWAHASSYSGHTLIRNLLYSYAETGHRSPEFYTFVKTLFSPSSPTWGKVGGSYFREILSDEGGFGRSLGVLLDDLLSPEVGLDHKSFFDTLMWGVHPSDKRMAKILAKIKDAFGDDVFYQNAPKFIFTPGVYQRLKEEVGTPVFPAAPYPLSLFVKKAESYGLEASLRELVKDAEAFSKEEAEKIKFGLAFLALRENDTELASTLWWAIDYWLPLKEDGKTVDVDRLLYEFIFSEKPQNWDVILEFTHIVQSQGYQLPATALSLLPIHEESRYIPNHLVEAQLLSCMPSNERIRALRDYYEFVKEADDLNRAEETLGGLLGKLQFFAGELPDELPLSFKRPVDAICFLRGYLNKGGSPVAYTEEGRPLLHLFLKEKFPPEAIAALLAIGVDPGEKSLSGETAFHILPQFSKEYAQQVLALFQEFGHALPEDVRLDAPPSNKVRLNPAFAWDVAYIVYQKASPQVFSRVLDLLYEKPGADIELGLNLAEHLVCEGGAEIIEYLKVVEKKLLEPDFPFKDTQLLHLAIENNSKIFKDPNLTRNFLLYMLDRGASLDERDNAKNTPIHVLAAKSGLFKDRFPSESLKTFLAIALERGADPFAQNSWKEVPGDIIDNMQIATIFFSEGFFPQNPNSLGYKLFLETPAEIIAEGYKKLLVYSPMGAIKVLGMIAQHPEQRAIFSSIHPNIELE